MAEAEEDLQNEDQEDQKDGAVAAGGQASNIVMLGRRYRILTDQPMPQLDHGEVKAYRALGMRDVECVAYLCKKELAPRHNHINSYGNLNHENVLRLEGFGVVFWAPDQQERFVVIYEGRIVAPIVPIEVPMGDIALGLKPDLVEEKIVRPLILALTELRNVDFIHGSVNPKNFYSTRAGVIDGIVLGECLSQPPSYSHSVLFETVERGMADPSGRGLGTQADDMYSFGVSIACLLRQRSPMTGMLDRDIIRYKIDNSSYNAILGGDRIKGCLWELLRGLLQDIPSQRWTFDDVLAWADGRRNSPKQTARSVKGARPFELAGNRHIFPESLVVDMAGHMSETMDVVENDKLQQWLERSISGDSYNTLLETARTSATESGKRAGYSARLHARVMLSLFPTAPLSYDGVSVMPMGIGDHICQSMALGEAPDVYRVIFMQNLATFWCNMQIEGSSDAVAVVREYEACRGYLHDKSLKGGIERCLYFMCHTAPCLSPVLKDYYVRHAEDLLRAFDRMGRNKRRRPVDFFDRHIIAFLISRSRRVIEQNISYLSSSSHHERILGTMRTLAEMYRMSAMTDLQGLSDWLCDYVMPMVKRIHNRETRVKVKEQLAVLRKSGNIEQIVKLFDDDRRVASDKLGYSVGAKEYKMISQEEALLDKSLEHRDMFGRRQGREISVVVSILIAGLIMFAFIFVSYAKEGEAIFR